MKIKDLLSPDDIVAAITGPDKEISAVVCDSRQVGPGALFVCIPGQKVDGNDFVTEAISKGAAAIVSSQPHPGVVPPEVTWIQVECVRKALATIAANLFGRPADKLQLVGITGTNGKTTTSFLIDSILAAAGYQSGLFGTIVHRTPAGVRMATMTTPQPLEFHRFLSEVVHAGGAHAVLEASSHALALDRLWGCRFTVAVFTNLTQDHLDFHATLDDYRAAKRMLFEGTGRGRPRTAVVNVDDAYGKELAGLAEETLTYGFSSDADITLKKYSLSLKGLEFTADTPLEKMEIRSSLLGRPNVYNLLAAIGAGIALKVPCEAIQAGIANLAEVPGRFERIEMGQPFLVVVDYAHTDDALRNLIAAARELGLPGRVITLFGCGGDRDRSKRPLMGAAAGSLSDVVVVTSDNPRGEDPLRIINDAVVGLQRTPAKMLVEPDREKAIDLAIEQARSGDVVLLAGKGHETVQVLKDRTVAFDDREVARRMLRERGYGS